MNKVLKENLLLALADIKLWKGKYIAKQLRKNPNISKEELSKKIKNAKASYFKRHHKEFDEAITKDIIKERKDKGEN